jgi:PAS domain S-box-containing protein
VQDAAELYRVLVDSVRDYAIFALDPDGYILSWNAGAKRFKGYESDEAIGKHFSIFYPPEKVAERFPEHELEVASRVGHFEDEGWRVRKDGSRFWANVVITALRGEGGELIGFAKVTRDLTERRRAELALQESEQRFRLLVQGVRDYAIFMLDASGHVATWNDGAERIKGYTADEIIGKHMRTFYPPEDNAADKTTHELEVAAREGSFEEEGWRMRKDGSRFWANVLITALRDERGRLIGFAKVTRDLTERNAAQARALEDARRLASEEAAREHAEERARELRELAARLSEQALQLELRSAEAESANKAKGAFLAAMSHELRTPLNAIGGYAELLQMGITGPVSSAQVEQLERIRRAQQHLLRVISEILNFSRVEAGQADYVISRVPMHATIESVAQMIAPQATRKEITLVHTFTGPELVARADEAKVQQVLLNLMSNALKFTAPGGRVSVWTERDGANVATHVCDTGIGIPADKLEAIFEPFVQVGRSLTSDHEGTGLGLSISRDLARGMGGNLVVSSHPGDGSTFTLTLPAG